MIWIIGGTALSVNVACKLHDLGFKLLVTTATELGKHQLPPAITVRTAPLDRQGMTGLISRFSIGLIIDISHPYAVEVSQNAIAVAYKRGVRYIRYERRELHCQYERKAFKSYIGIVDYLSHCTGNILLTTGSKNLHFFKNLDRDRLFVRLLPRVESISKAESLGFLPKNILALHGPFSVELNRAIIKEYKIKFLVTKQSGTEGGEGAKYRAASLEKAFIISLTRPVVRYPLRVYDTETLISMI